MNIEMNELEQKRLWFFISGNGYIYHRKEEISAMHRFVRFRKPKPLFCEECKFKEEKLELSNNKKHNYTYKIEDYDWLCDKCHGERDSGIINKKDICLVKKIKMPLIERIEKRIEDNKRIKEENKNIQMKINLKNMKEKEKIDKNIKDFFENVLDGISISRMVSRKFIGVIMVIEEDIVKEVTIDDLGRLVIPIKLREKLKIKGGDKILLREFGRFIALYPEGCKDDVKTFENLYNKQTDIKKEIFDLKIDFDNLREMVIKAAINQDYGFLKEEIKKLIKDVLKEERNGVLFR